MHIHYYTKPTQIFREENIGTLLRALLIDNESASLIVFVHSSFCVGAPHIVYLP